MRVHATERTADVSTEITTEGALGLLRGNLNEHR